MTKQYLIDLSLLEKGDILLTSVGELPSAGVRTITKSDYSHAMLYAGGSSYIHSDLTGVHADNLQRLLLDSPSRAAVLRLRRPSRDGVADEAIMYARRKVGTQYSKREAAGTVVEKLRSGLENRQFCSRLVAQAFAEAGVQLVADPNYCTPQDIFASAELFEVTGCVREASPEESNFVKAANPLAEQRRITNAFLQEVREISGRDVQQYEQVAQCVLDHPEYDEAITQALQRSGYLETWKIDVEINPWRYDAEIYLNSANAAQDLIESAHYEIQSAAEMIARFEFLYSQYDEINGRFPRRYFQTERSLYAILVSLHTKRQEAARTVVSTLKGSDAIAK